MLHVIGSKQTLETDFATGKQEFADHKMNDSGSSFGDIFKQIVNLPEPTTLLIRVGSVNMTPEACTHTKSTKHTMSDISINTDEAIAKGKSTTAHLVSTMTEY